VIRTTLIGALCSLFLVAAAAAQQSDAIEKAKAAAEAASQRSREAEAQAREAIEKARRETQKQADAARQALETSKSAGNTNRPNQIELEKTFSERMTGSTLVGHFTDRTREKAALKEEKYSLGKVAKVDGDKWLFEARIQYGQHDVTVPLTLRVVWAGDTPVITLDDFLVPGFGRFTCRVMIFGDQYAGTWDGANHGGHLFGKIVRDQKVESENATTPSGGAKNEKSK
jgi:hypothetical protein